MKPMRICVISGADIEKFYGQTTRPYYISENLAKNGCSVLHICVNPPKQSDTLKYISIRYYNNKSRIVRKLRNFMRIYTECKNFFPNIIYAHQLGSAVISLVLHYLTKIPVVYDAHSSPFLEIDTCQNVSLYNKSKWKIQEKIVSKKSVKIISASKRTTDFLIGAYHVPKIKIHTIEVGVDCNQFTSDRIDPDIRSQLSISNIDKVVLFTCPRDASNFSNIMALEYLFKLILKIEQRRKNLKFLIAGGGEEIPPPSKNVIYTGFVDNLAKYINIADVCIMPYPANAIAGGTRNKLIEYFACGKPVVSTTEGIKGFNDTIPNKHFLLADNSNEFINKMLLILDDNNLSETLGINARELALKYDWNDISLRVLEVLNEGVNYSFLSPC